MSTLRKKGVLYRVEYTVQGAKGLGVQHQHVFADDGETHDDVRRYFRRTHAGNCIIKRIGTKRIKDSSKLFHCVT